MVGASNDLAPPQVPATGAMVLRARARDVDRDGVALNGTCDSARGVKQGFESPWGRSPSRKIWSLSPFTVGYLAMVAGSPEPSEGWLAVEILEGVDLVTRIARPLSPVQQVLEPLVILERIEDEPQPPRNNGSQAR